MSKPADDHTENLKGVVKGIQIDENSVHNSESQLDDDCVSENSFGSHFDDNAMDDEKNMTADIELDSSLPVCSDEENLNPFQSTSTLDDMYVSYPSVDQTVVPQYTPPTTRSTTNTKFSGPSMCVVCKLLPAYSKGGVFYPTCGLTCASKIPSSTSESQSRRSAKTMCVVCNVRPQAQKYPTCGFTCAASLTKSPTSKGGAPLLDPALPREVVKSLQKLSLSDTSDRHISHISHGHHKHRPPTDRHRLSQVHQPLNCVVCQKPCRNEKYVTCGMTCADRLYRRGNSNPNMCDYCHRRPKVPGYNQCGKTCRDNASTACLLCRSRPKFGRYHFCGRTCKMIATQYTPLILEARRDHITYIEVEQRFKRAWKGNDVCPSIKKVYKIIENKSFLLPYDRYKKRVGNEVFRYYGISRSCALGSRGNTRLCSSTTCALCSILRTSFNVTLANPFGAGVYTSSAANKAYNYSRGGTDAIILTKVVLGTAYKASAFNEVMSCPPGYNSVDFNRQNGMLNETIVYTNNAIRPVFLIIF